MAEGRGPGHAHGDDHDADVDDHPAVGPPHQTPPPGQGSPSGRLAGGPGTAPGAPHREHQGPAGRGGGEGPEAEGQQGLDPVDPGGHADHHHQDAQGGRDGQAAPQHGGRRLAPRQGRGHGHQEEQGQGQRDGEPVEVGGAHRHLGTRRDGLVQEREDRPQQDHEGEEDEEQVVGQEGPLPAEGRVDPPGRPEAVAPPGDEAHPDQDHRPEEAEQEGTDGRGREGVHRLDHPGAGEEGAQDGEAEGGHHQGQVPHLEDPPALGDHDRVEVGRADQPRQERGVLHRVPGPEAAPPQHLVGPPRPQHDPERQEGPGEQGPPPGLPLPVLVEAAGDQGGHGEGEGHGEPDEAQVEHRRVEEDQRVVLEEDVGSEPVGRRGAGHMAEGVGRPQHQGEEEGGHGVEDEGGPRHQGVGGPAAEPDHQSGGVAPEDDAPQEDGAGQGRPHPGDGVEERRGPAVVVGHVDQGEVVGDQGPLHGHHGHHAAGQHQRRIEPAAAERPFASPGQAHGQDHDAHHGGDEAQQDPGVAECAVHLTAPDARRGRVNQWTRRGRVNASTRRVR